MKILYFVEKFLAPSETFIDAQIEWFQRRHHVSILCTKTQENYNKAYEVKCIPFKKTIRNKLSKKLHYLSSYNSEFSVTALRYIKRSKPDIIHCHFGIQALILLDNTHSLNIPIFVTFHGYDTLPYIKQSIAYRRRWKKLFNNKNIHPIFVCKYHLDLFARHNIVSNKSNLLYNGVYPELFRRKNYNKANKFIQISRFTGKKGHLFTIKAFELFHVKNKSIPFQLTLVGNGIRKKEILSYLETSEIKPFVKLLDWVEHNNIPQILEDHTYYVQHSITSKKYDIEATSISILEAMAMEMPILSSIHAGIPETVIHGKHGLLCKEKDLPTYANQILEILSWSFLENNRMHILKKFDLDKRNKILENLFQNARSSTKMDT